MLDLTANIAGPLACQIMADLGAEVVKVEPRSGEAARHITASAAGAAHLTPYFSSYNRGKKSVQVELADPADLAALKRLVASADVLVQGMRPGTLRRYGLAAEDVRTLNPRCIYVSISAFGGGSDLEDRPGVDMLVQAESGCLSRQPAGQPPRLIPFQVVDGATGHVTAQAVLAALLHRERFGVADEVRVAMYDVACSLQANHLTMQLNGAPHEAAGPYSTPVAVEPSGVFATADGYVVLAAYVQSHWERLAHLLGCPELAQDDRYASQPLRAHNAAALKAALAPRLRLRTTGEWVSLLASAGLMVAAVHSWGDVVSSELFERRGLRMTVQQDGRSVDVIRTPAVLSDCDTTSLTAVPARGQDDALLGVES